MTKKANTWLMQIFGQILDQGQAIMSQMTAKHEGTKVRIRRKGVSCIKWPFLEISTLSSEFNRPPKKIPKGSRAVLCKVTDHWQFEHLSPLS